MLSDFIGDVELGLLDDMQDEVRKLREEMGEESVKEEQQKNYLSWNHIKEIMFI